ncbi:MAG TPA: hypothetical protein VJ726_04140 [Candidatus Limnocylindria bacterium]|nr:hypothetical protein [Candidatus Limnocylindria bacterium]
MELLSRPWFRLTAVAVITLVGLFVVGIVGAQANPPIPLPYRDSLVSTPHLLEEWDISVSRARYVPDGYEILVKEPGRTAATIPDTWHDWDLTIGVSVEFRPIGGSWSDDDAAPSAGVICTSDDADYDFRVGVDGRYAVRRWSGVGAGRTSKLLASNITLGAPKVTMRSSVRLLVVCQRRAPTTLKLSVDGKEVLTVRDSDDARAWGRAGVIVGSGKERDVSVVFRDLLITGR